MLTVYNTLTRSKERFEAIRPGEVGIYSCGPTVYQYQHVGNMRAYLFADTLKRVLEYNGYAVRHVINITDVGHLTSDEDTGEDKMEVSAKKQNRTAWELAELYTEAFKKDLESLNVLPPTLWCKATDHIPEMIAMIETLAAKGFIYTIDDGVYFDTSKDPHYGEMSTLDLSDEGARSRIGVVADKRHDHDFALWKFSPAGVRRQMEWDSPWGRGFPGWHIECSAMSTRYLGTHFDLHTGGIDHISVHHTNEIAQSENALGVRPWVNYWMHCAFLTFGETKMSKSRGNVLLLADLQNYGIDPLAYRYMCLGAHYRTPLAFSDSGLAAAWAGFRRLVRRTRDFLDREPSGESAAVKSALARFRAAVNDDLNTPRALAVLWDGIRSDELNDGEKLTLIRETDRVFGLDLERQAARLNETDVAIEAAIQERADSRAAGDYSRADQIRQRLQSEGIVLEDTRFGTKWRRADS